MLHEFEGLSKALPGGKQKSLLKKADFLNLSQKGPDPFLVSRVNRKLVELTILMKLIVKRLDRNT